MFSSTSTGPPPITSVVGPPPTSSTQFHTLVAVLQSLASTESLLPSVLDSSDTPQAPSAQTTLSLHLHVSLYVRYMSALRQLERVYDTMLQVQRRADLRNVMEALNVRILRLSDLLRTMKGEYTRELDDVLLDLKISPEHIFGSDRGKQLSSSFSYVPRYFLEETTTIPPSNCPSDPPLTPYAIRQRLWNYILSRYGHSRDSLGQLVEDLRKSARYGVGSPLSVAGRTTSSSSNEHEMSLRQAVLLIQTCERGRQARVRTKYKLGVKRQTEAFLERQRQQRLAEEQMDRDGATDNEEEEGEGEGTTGDDGRLRMGLSPSSSSKRMSSSYNSPSRGGSNRVSEKDRAALIIQSLFRGWRVRRAVLRMKQQEEIFLGMRPDPAQRRRCSDLRSVLHKIRVRTKLLQRHHETEYAERRSAMREAIVQGEGRRMRRDLRDLTMQRFLQHWQTIENPKDLPYFPTEEEGGSKKFMQPIQNAETEEFLLSQANEAENGGNGGEAGGGARRRRNQQQPQQQRSSTSSGPGNTASVEVNPDDKMSVFVSLSNYLRKWSSSSSSCSSSSSMDLDSSDTLSSSSSSTLSNSQAYDEEMLRTELMSGTDGIEEQIRREEDDAMRKQIQNLNVAMGKVKKSKPSRRGGRRGRRNRNRGRRNTAESPESDGETSDPSVVMSETGDSVMSGLLTEEQRLQEERARKIDQETLHHSILFVELGLQLLIREVSGIHLEDFVGSHNFLGTAGSLAWCEPSMAHVRRVALEVILSMGSETIHKNAPLTKGLLLFGPPLTGKTMLAKAIASEVGATFFDLSPRAVFDHYDPKQFPDLLDIVFTLAKRFQPSVVFIDEVEQYFGKAKAQGISRDVSKLQKIVMAEIKKWCVPENRILIIGSSKAPWKANKAQLLQTFDRALYTSIPTYGTYQIIWKTFLEQKTRLPLPEDFDLQTLSHISEGFSAGQLRLVVDRVLTNRRISKLPSLRPLEAQEFIGPLARFVPVFEETNADFMEFVDSLPLRYRMYSAADAEAERAALERASGANETGEGGGGRGASRGDRGRGRGRRGRGRGRRRG